LGNLHRAAKMSIKLINMSGSHLCYSRLLLAKMITSTHNSLRLSTNSHIRIISSLKSYDSSIELCFK